MKHWVLIKWLDEQLQSQREWVEIAGDSPLQVSSDVLARFGDRLGLTIVQSHVQLASSTFDDAEIAVVVERAEQERAAAERAIAKTKPEPKPKRKASK